MKDPRKAKGKGKAKPKAPKEPKVAEAEPMEGSREGAPSPAVWRPGQDPMEEGETLDYDPTAYDCLHALTLDWPCLSFALLKDDLGGPRSAFPHTLYFAAATQAATSRANYIALIRVNNLQQGKHGQNAATADDSDQDMSDSDEEEEEGPPVMHTRTIALTHGANRIRAMPQRQGVLAVWEDAGQVKVFDASAPLDELAQSTSSTATRSKVLKPELLHTQRHSTEGYALDWSQTTAGRLASGDNRANIHVWEPSTSGASWTVSGSYRGHSDSVEDLQWSPSEATVFASASSDRTIRIWDTRERARAMLSVAAHDADVNVISWNALTSYMLASGGDEGALRVWDLRNFADGSFVANFTHHKSPITSVEWCPNEASMLATSGADGQLCVWDLALERDPEEEINLGAANNANAPEDLPPQLLFVHGGQQDPKEVHWHSQIPGMLVSTAADGFNIFKPSNV